MKLIVLLKYVILLALCSPLGFIGYENAKNFYNTMRVGSEQPPMPVDTQRLQENGEQAKKFSNSLRTTNEVIVCVSDKDIGAIEESQWLADIREKVKARADALYDTLVLLEAIPKVDEGADVKEVKFRVDKHDEYKNYLDYRKKGRKVYEDTKTLHSSTLMEFEKTLKQDSKRPLDDGSSDTIDTKIKNTIKQLEDCDKAKNLKHEECIWVEYQLASWKQANAILSLADDMKELVRQSNVSTDDISTDKVKEVLQRNKSMLEANKLSPEFKDLVKAMAKRFGTRCLPKPLKLDDVVVIYDKDKNNDEIVNKKDLMIIFKNDEEIKFMDHNKDGDEFLMIQEIANMQVKRFALKTPMLRRILGSDLKATQKSKAAHQYNSLKSDWDVAALKKLIDDPDFERYFPRERSRIIYLVNALADY